MKYLMILFGGILMSCNNIETKKTIQNKGRVANLRELADSLYNGDNYEEAVKYFDTLITIDSLNGEYYFKRGYCEAMLFKYHESTIDYKKAIQFKYRESSAYFNLGLNYSSIDDSLAIHFFYKCLEVDPKHPNARVKIAESERRLKGNRHVLKKDNDTLSQGIISI